MGDDAIGNGRRAPVDSDIVGTVSSDAKGHWRTARP